MHGPRRNQLYVVRKYAAALGLESHGDRKPKLTAHQKREALERRERAATRRLPRSAAATM
jgi:hypothetical protein